MILGVAGDYTKSEPAAGGGGDRQEDRAVLPPPPNSSNIACRSGRTSRHHRWRDIMLCTAASRPRALTAAIAAFLVVAAAASAQEATEPKDHAARIEAFKASVISGVEARRKLAQVMNDTVFSFGELAYQEFGVFSRSSG